MKTEPQKIKKTKENYYGSLGDLIRTARLERNLALQYIADVCQCSVQFISNIEHGRAPLPWCMVPLISKALEIPVEDLQIANLSARSDFKGFFKTGSTEQKSQLKNVKNLSHILSALALASKDAQLCNVIYKYQAANLRTRKRFLKLATDILQKD